MPAKSKSQARLFGAIAGGQKVRGVNISREKAKEFTRGVKVSKLPERKTRRDYK